VRVSGFVTCSPTHVWLVVRSVSGRVHRLRFTGNVVSPLVPLNLNIIDRIRRPPIGLFPLPRSNRIHRSRLTRAIHSTSDPLHQLFIRSNRHDGASDERYRCVQAREINREDRGYSLWRSVSTPATNTTNRSIEGNVWLRSGRNRFYVACYSLGVTGAMYSFFQVSPSRHWK
jgi:hypothetical protein